MVTQIDTLGSCIRVLPRMLCWREVWNRVVKTLIKLLYRFYVCLLVDLRRGCSRSHASKLIQLSYSSRPTLLCISPLHSQYVQSVQVPFLNLVNHNILNIRDILKNDLLFNDLRLLGTGETLIRSLPMWISWFRIKVSIFQIAWELLVVFCDNVLLKLIIHDIITGSCTAAKSFLVLILSLWITPIGVNCKLSLVGLVGLWTADVTGGIPGIWTTPQDLHEVFIGMRTYSTVLTLTGQTYVEVDPVVLSYTLNLWTLNSTKLVTMKALVDLALSQDLSGLLCLRWVPSQISHSVNILHP
jgi:hypothetical protein